MCAGANNITYRFSTDPCSFHSIFSQRAKWIWIFNTWNGLRWTCMAYLEVYNTPESQAQAKGFCLGWPVEKNFVWDVLSFAWHGCIWVRLGWISVYLFLRICHRARVHSSFPSVTVSCAQKTRDDWWFHALTVDVNAWTLGDISHVLHRIMTSRPFIVVIA